MVFFSFALFWRTFGICPSIHCFKYFILKNVHLSEHFLLLSLLMDSRYEFFKKVAE